MWERRNREDVSTGTDTSSQESTTNDGDSDSADNEKEDVKLDILWFADGVENRGHAKKSWITTKLKILM